MFLACGVAAPVAAKLHEVLEPYRREYSGRAFRWIEPYDYHVTLRFFGNLTDTQIASAAQRIEPIAATTSAIPCRACDLDAFASASRPNVIVLPIVSDGRLEALAWRANAALEDAFGSPDRSFKAHLTVARCQSNPRFLAATDAIDFALEFASIALFESSRSQSGARYTALHEFALRGQ